MNLPEIKFAKMISLDLETFDPNLKLLGPGTFRGDGWPVGIALKPADGPGFYLPIKPGIGFDKAAQYLNEQLGTNCPKLGANILYDLEWLHWLGVKVNGPKYDVQVAEPLLDENNFQYNLDAIAQRRGIEGKLKGNLLEAAQRYDSRIKKHSDVFKVIYKMKPEEVAPYAVQDVELPFQIFEQQVKELQEQDLMKVFMLETELIDLLLEMRIKGVRVDVEKAQQVGEELEKSAEVLQNELDKLCGIHVDIWSADSIAKAFDRLNIKYPYTAKTKAPSFTAPWLEAHDSVAAKLLVKLRKTKKMKNDFIDHMIIRSAVNGRIHPQFNSVKNDTGGTVSGRFSSSNPNLQQVPARDPVYGPMIRGLFIPEEGMMWAKFDYKAQEPRLTVHYAYLMNFPGADEAVRKYNEDPMTDYHQMTADLCGIERTPAKTINLGLAYGMGIPLMAQNLGRTLEETKELYAKYHKGMPFVKMLSDRCTQIATTRGYIKTILGRRRRFDLYFPANFDKDNPATPLKYDEALKLYGLPLRRAFTHKALNALIQGSGADMTKQGMLNVYKAGYIPHLTVHDEIDLSLENEKQANEIKEILEHAVELVIPVVAEMFLEKSWGKCK